MLFAIALPIVAVVCVATLLGVAFVIVGRTDGWSTARYAVGMTALVVLGCFALVIVVMLIVLALLAAVLT